MARALKENGENNLESTEDVRLWATAVLISLSNLANQDELRVDPTEIVEAALLEVERKVKDEIVHQAAEELFAIALTHLDQLEDDTYRTKLITTWFPTDSEHLIDQLRLIQDEYRIGVQTIGRLIKTIDKPEKQRPEKVLESLNIIVRKLKRRPDREIFKTILDFVVLIWPNLSHEERKQFQKVFTDLSISLAKQDPIGTTELYSLWQEKLFQIGKESDVNRPDLGLVHIALPDGPKYSEALLRLLPVKIFDQFGYAIRNGARDSAVSIEELTHQYSNILTVLTDYPDFSLMVMERIVDVFEEAGFIRRFKSGKFRLTSSGKAVANLGYNELETVQMATRILSESRKGKVPGGISSMDDITAAYEAYHQSITIPELEIVTDDDNRRVLYIADLLFGQKDLNTKVLNDILKQLKLLPQSERPHHVILSGFVAGAFQYRQKDRRAALALESMDDQFSAAKVFIDELLELGLKISYVLSEEDKEQARNYALMALKSIEHSRNPQKDTNKRHISYGEEARMRQPGKEPGQADLWDIHYDFQINVVFPYYYRTGRRLRSADEIYAMRIVREEYKDLTAKELQQTPGVYIRQEEYLILYDAYQRLVSGEELPSHYKKILDVDKIPVPGKEFTDFGIYNGMVLKAKTTSRQFNSLLHHNGFEYSPTGLKRVPLNKILAQLGDMEAAGIELPDEVVTFHQQQGMGLGRVISLPGFGGVNLFQRSQTFSVSGELALRQISRGTGVPNPGAIQRTLYDDGRVVTTFYTDYQMRTIDAGPRTAWIPFSDTHVGNVAAALDHYLRFQDYALKDVARQYDQVVLLYLGDAINGKNVVSAEDENAPAGLPSLVHQEAMYHLLLKEGLTQGEDYDHLPDFLGNIVRAYVVTGNHELNTGRRKGNQHTFAQGTTDLLGRILGEDKVEYLGSMRGAHGQILMHHGGVTQHHGGTKAYASHKLRWARFGAGNGVLDGQKIIHGLGSVLSPDINLLIMGDQHVGKWGFAAGKLVLVVPSTCFTTGFEFGLGLWTQPGGMVYASGGGSAPELHEIPLDVIANHRITSGSLTDEAIASRNPRLATDPDYQLSDGLYAGPYKPHNALQKWIIDQTSEIVGGNQSQLGK